MVGLLWVPMGHILQQRVIVVLNRRDVLYFSSLCRGAFRILFVGAMNGWLLNPTLGLYPQVRECIWRNICEISGVAVDTGFVTGDIVLRLAIKKDLSSSASGQCSAARKCCTE